MALLSALGGLRWTEPSLATTPMVGPRGHVPRQVRFVYSLDGPHYVELLEQLDSTAYDMLTGGRRIHHLGFVARDLEGDARRLDEAGFRLEMHGIDEDGLFARATYHYSPLFPGVWVELVDPRTWAEIRDWIETTKESRDG